MILSPKVDIESWSGHHRDKKGKRPAAVDVKQPLTRKKARLGIGKVTVGIPFPLSLLRSVVEDISHVKQPPSEKKDYPRDPDPRDFKVIFDNNSEEKADPDPGEFKVFGDYKFEEADFEPGEFKVFGDYKFEEADFEPGDFKVFGDYKFEEADFDPGDFKVFGDYKFEEADFDPGDFKVSGDYNFEEADFNPGEFKVSGDYKFEEEADFNPGEFKVSGDYNFEEEGAEAVGRRPKKNKLKVQACKKIQGLKEKLMAIPIPPADSDVIQLRSINPKDLRIMILSLVNEACKSLDKKEGLYFRLKKATTRYKADLGYYVACLSNKYKRNVHEANSSKKASVYAGILNWIYNLSHTTNYLPGRMLYYEDENLIQDTTYVYNCVDDLCAHFGCPRVTLRVIPASSTGLVFGRLEYKVYGEVFKCDSKFNVIPIPIPNESIIDHVEILPCGVDFILIVQKETVFTVIKNSSFCNEYNCLLITGRGEADTSTRLFARKLRDHLKVPVFGLMDGNIHGIQIMGVYKHGSMQKALENHRMAIPDMKWIGIHPGDFPSVGNPTVMTDQDFDKCDQLLEYEWVKGNKKLVEKIKYLKSKKKNFEIDQFVAADYLLKLYLPRKLSSEDSWI